MNRAYTLIEVLLSTVLLLLLSASCVFNMTGKWNGFENIETKRQDFITLMKFAKCHAATSGIQTKVNVENNRLSVFSEDYSGNKMLISSVQSMVDSINEGIFFDSNEENVINYYPDGNVEMESQIWFSFDLEFTNVFLINVSEWNNIEMISTNFPSISEPFK